MLNNYQFRRQVQLFIKSNDSNHIIDKMNLNMYHECIQNTGIRWNKYEEIEEMELLGERLSEGRQNESA